MNATIDHQAELLGHEFDSFRPGVTGSALAGLSAAGMPISPTAFDAFYNQAWYGVYARINSGEPVGVHEDLLSEIARRRAIDEFRIANPNRRLDSEVLEAVGIADPIGETAEEQRELHALSEHLRSEFNQWELQAATLHLVFGFTLPAAAQKVGVDPVRLIRVVAEISNGFETALGPAEDGEPCPERGSLVNQFAFGVFGPRSDEYREAVEHLNVCSACRRHVPAARALTAVTISSRAVVVALTIGIPAGAPRAASPLAAPAATAPETERRKLAPVAYSSPRGSGRRKAAIIAVVATLIVGGFALMNRSSGGDGAQINAAQTSGDAAAQHAKAKAARAKRKARAARKHRAEKRRAEKRRAARKRAAARRRAQLAAQQNTATPAPAQVQTPVQSVPQQQVATPAPKPTKQQTPSTDPSQEFNVH